MNTLRELWAYRELLYFLAWRDVRVRYRNLALGAVWMVGQPLMTAAVLNAIFGRMNLHGGSAPYFIYAFSGLWLWTFFSGSLLGAATSLTANTTLITKVYFPRIIVPASAVAARCVDIFVGVPVLLALLAWYGIGPGPAIFALPIVIAAIGGLALATGLLLGAAAARLRDLTPVIPFVVQLLFFVTPVMYDPGQIPERWRAVFGLNPLFPLFSGTRALIFGTEVDWSAIAVATGVCAAFLAVCAAIFRRQARLLADIL